MMIVFMEYCLKANNSQKLKLVGYLPFNLKTELKTFLFISYLPTDT